MSKEKGLRFNEGKLRYDLLHPAAQQGIVRVLTKGAQKYAPRNWEKGMPWMDVVASLERHLAAFKAGEDYDPETGELHMDHVQCNAHFLSAYYKIAPEYDDRTPLRFPKQKKIGLDIDDVICSWVKPWCEQHNIDTPNSWNFDYELSQKFEAMRANSELNNFYLALPALIDPAELPFVPECYITHRPVEQYVTQAWLELNNFPLKPVFQVKNREDKVKVAQEQGLDIFVDDNYDTFVAMNKAGICCYLMDQPHNQRHDVGYRRIKSLKELKF